MSLIDDSVIKILSSVAPTEEGGIFIKVPLRSHDLEIHITQDHINMKIKTTITVTQANRYLCTYYRIENEDIMGPIYEEERKS